MKLSLALLSIAAAAAAAQSIGDSVPACAAPCLTTAITSATSCTITEAACQCAVDNYRAIYTAALNCILNGCGADVAINQVLPAAEQFCLTAVGPVGAPSSPAQQNSQEAPSFTNTPGRKEQVPAGASANTSPSGSIQPSIPNTVTPSTTSAGSSIPTPAPTPTTSRLVAAANPTAVGSFFAFGAALAVFVI